MHPPSAAGLPLFHTHVVVDWSARSQPSPALQSKDAIWWAAARTDGGGVTVDEPAYVRTRHEALARLARLVAGELDAGGGCWWASIFLSAIRRALPCN